MFNFTKNIANSIQAVLAICVSSVALWGQVNVLTGGYSAERTNANPRERILNTVNVTTAQFGKLFTLPVDGQVYAQPLYVQGVAIPDRGAHNVVYVVTMHNTVYAFDADVAADPLWSVNLGSPAPASDYKSFDIVPEIGILSTPVIDNKTSTLYVVANTKEDGQYFFRLHALDLTTGQEKNNGPVVITGEVPGTGDASSDGTVRFDSYQHIQRPALLLSRGVVYIGFGSHGDVAPYHGWLFGYSASDLQTRTAVLNFSPNGSAASLWHGGRGPAADRNGFIYVSTGNGSWDGVTEWGQSFLKLDPDKGLAIVDSFTPSAWSGLNDEDYDIGSTGAVLVPGTNLLLGGDKGGTLYVMDRNSMGEMTTGDASLHQSVQAIPPGAFNLAIWEGPRGQVVYVQPWGDVIRAFQFAGDKLQSDPSSISTTATYSALIGMTVSSNGPAPRSAILWVTTTSASRLDMPFAGVLRAFDANDLSRELWNSEMVDKDDLGLFAKFANPTVVNGKVYVPTFSNTVAVYGRHRNTPSAR